MNELNKIRLDDSTLTLLYRNSLVNLVAVKVMVAIKSKLTGGQEEFLTQILAACKLQPSQVTIVNTSEKGVTVENVINRLSPQYILSFGAGSGTELFWMENSVGRKFLTAPALDELMQDSEASKQLKRKTWAELKTIFGL